MVLHAQHPHLFFICCVIQLSLNLRINRLFLTVLFLQQTGLYEYKVFGVLEDTPPALLADVYMDLDYRKQWDQHVKGELTPAIKNKSVGK